MDCPECARLKANHDLKSLLRDLARSILKDAEMTADAANYMALRRRFLEAEIDLSLVETEIAQHQDRHAVTN